MASRLNLQDCLEKTIDNKNVYYQSPSLNLINYPAVVYSLDGVDSSFSNNAKYAIEKKYTLTLIEKDPDSILFDKLLMLDKCRFVNHYVSDNLHHYVFSIYY